MRFEEVQAGDVVDGPVRIGVRAAPITFPDALMVVGPYQVSPDLPLVPGVEGGDEVPSAPAASGFNVGDRVMALLDNSDLRHGGYAEIADAAPGPDPRCPT